MEVYYNQLLDLVSFLAVFPLFFTLILGVIKEVYKVFQFKTLWYFILFELIILLALRLLLSEYYNFIDFFLRSKNINSTSFLSILSYFNYYITLSYFFILINPKSNRKKIIKILSFFLLILTLLDSLYFTGINQYSTFSHSLLAIYNILLSLMQLEYVYKTDSKVQLNRNPYFWISLGIILPNLLGFWLELFGELLQKEDIILFYQVSIAYSIFYIFGMLLIARGFYFARYVKYLPVNT